MKQKYIIIESNDENNDSMWPGLEIYLLDSFKEVEDFLLDIYVSGGNIDKYHVHELGDHKKFKINAGVTFD